MIYNYLHSSDSTLCRISQRIAYKGKKGKYSIFVLYCPLIIKSYQRLIINVALRFCYFFNRFRCTLFLNFDINTYVLPILLVARGLVDIHCPIFTLWCLEVYNLRSYHSPGIIFYTTCLFLIDCLLQCFRFDSAGRH